MTRMQIGILVLAASAALYPAAAQEASTIRIEPRPFYGATVTLEEGVRVFRPLPVHKHVIINPGSQTPLSLGLYDERNYNYNHNYNYTEPSFVPGAGYGVGFADDFGRLRHHRRHHRHHGPRHGLVPRAH